MFVLLPLLATLSHAAYQQPGGHDDYEDNNFVTGGYGGPVKGQSGGHHGPTEGHHGLTVGHHGPTGGHHRPTGSQQGPTGVHNDLTREHHGPIVGHQGPASGHHGPAGGHHGGSLYDGGSGGPLGGNSQGTNVVDGSGHDGGYGQQDGGEGAYDVAEEWKPYAFSYSSSDPEGTHSHQQQADSKNRVTGQYSIMMADGRMRIVKYVADENGFRAEIVTNEQGTESKNPADVTIQSSALTGDEAAKQFGSVRSNSRFDQYSQAPQQGGHHGGDGQDQDGHHEAAHHQLANQQNDGHHRDRHHQGNPIFVNTDAPNQHGGSQNNQKVGSGSSYGQDENSRFSDSHSYTKHDSRRFSSYHNEQNSFAKNHNDFQSTGYQGHSSHGNGYDQSFSQPAPASFGNSGGYGNDISELEDDVHHTDTGYYSGTGARSYGGSKASRHRNKSSYG